MTCLRAGCLAVSMACAITALGAAFTAAHSAENSAATAKAPASHAALAEPAQERSSDQSLDTVTPLSVQIIGTDANVEHERAREAKSDEHDAADLQAQVRSADAAEQQILPAWVGILATLFGTWFVYWNLREVRRANAIAEKALQTQIRPWVGIEQAALISLQGNQKPDVRVLVKNFGQGTALKVRISVNCSICSGTLVPDLPPLDTSHVTLFPQHEVLMQPFARGGRACSIEEVGLINSGVDKLWVISHISYESASGTIHVTETWMRYDAVTKKFTSTENRDRAT